LAVSACGEIYDDSASILPKLGSLATVDGFLNANRYSGVITEL